MTLVKETTNARRTSTITTGSQSGSAASNPKPAVAGSVSKSVTGPSSARTNNRNVPVAKRGTQGRQATRAPIQAVRRDWRANQWTSFILGLIILEGLAQLVTANWRVGAAFAAGMIYAAIMWPVKQPENVR